MPDTGQDSDDPDDSPSSLRLAPGQRTPLSEPEMNVRLQGSLPGSRRVRRTRERDITLRRVGESEFEATAAALRPDTRIGRVLAKIRHGLIGVPLASSQAVHERLSKVKALAIFSSDNLSSSAYATEEMLLVLILAGTVAFSYALPIALTITLLVAIVSLSYIQLVRAYPRGGGAYDVTRVNLGTNASLIAGSTLCIDFILTVSVSTAAGVAAITSAVPELHDHKIELALVFVALLTLANLRGTREAGTIFALPSYFFILTFGGMLVVGIIRLALGHDLQAGTPENAVEQGTAAVTLFLILRAFSSGAAALTGIEALAEGTPSFKPPEARNAAITLAIMATILAAFFIGTTALATEMNVVPSESRTVVSQIAEGVFGENVLFYMVQVGTAMILVLAANTAFAGLPTLASVMARDGVMPKQFAFRGDRLAFSNGIIVLGLAAGLVLVLFKADTHNLVPLYAFGVFVAFTLSQTGMVLHWRNTRGPRWRLYLAINGIGATTTAIVAVIVGTTKFTEGAWLSMLAMALLALALWRIHKHYKDASEQLGRGIQSPSDVAGILAATPAGGPKTVIVPVEDIDRSLLRTLAYARGIASETIAVHVVDTREAGDAFRDRWEEAIPNVPLVILDSPYRSLEEPLLAYIDAIQRVSPLNIITVVLPEFVPKHFWERYLHNQLAGRLKDNLIRRPNTAVIEVPFHFR